MKQGQDLLHLVQLKQPEYAPMCLGIAVDVESFLIIAHRAHCAKWRIVVI